MILWTNGMMDVDGECIWIISYTNNLLCKYNVVHKQVEQSVVWTDVNCEVGAAYTVKKLKDCIVVVPALDNVIRVVNKNEEIIEYTITEVNHKHERYYYASIVENEVVLFPSSEFCIIRVGANGIKKEGCEINGISSCVASKGDVILTNSSKNVWKYNARTSTLKCALTVEDSQVCWCGLWRNSLILFTKDGRVLMTEEKNTKGLTKIASAPQESFFSHGIVVDNNLLLFAYQDAMRIWCLNLVDGCIGYRVLEKDSYWIDWEYNAFSIPVELKGKIYVMSPNHRALFVLERNGAVIERQHIELKAGGDVGLKMIRQKIRSWGSTPENDVCRLDDFLKYLEEQTYEE